jgi:hypothetical protein
MMEAHGALLCRLKSASPAKQEAARLEVENAEDDLVQKTEVAITLMKTVLDNVRIISSLRPSFANAPTTLSSVRCQYIDLF